jgi:hypothetical protein
MQSQNTAAIDSPTSEDDSAAGTVDVSSLHELLAAPEPEQEPTSEDDKGAASGNAEKKAAPEMFNDLAESVGIELDDLYKLKVSTKDGETVTIEELKALQTSSDEIVVRGLEFEEQMAEKESGLRQAQNELAEVVASLPNGTITPAVLEKLREKNATRKEVENTRTMTAIPSWKDEATRTKELTGMAAHLERFGFPANHLASVQDHRQIVFIRESFLREQRIKTALGRVRAGKPNPTTSTKTAGKSPANASGKTVSGNSRPGLDAFFSSI